MNPKHLLPPGNGFEKRTVGNGCLIGWWERSNSQRSSDGAGLPSTGCPTAGIPEPDQAYLPRYNPCLATVLPPHGLCLFSPGWLVCCISQVFIFDVNSITQFVLLRTYLFLLTLDFYLVTLKYEVLVHSFSLLYILPLRVYTANYLTTVLLRNISFNSNYFRVYM